MEVLASLEAGQRLFDRAALLLELEALLGRKVDG